MLDPGSVPELSNASSPADLLRQFQKKAGSALIDFWNMLVTLELFAVRGVSGSCICLLLSTPKY